MELTDREKDLLSALKGTTKSALSFVPGLGQAIAGYDAYRQSQFERNLLNIIKFLNDKVQDLEALFSSAWLKAEEGQQFMWKVLDSALDSQLEDKQELFVNVLVNGVRESDIHYLEKLMFVDMLRRISRFSLIVLAEIHEMFLPQVRGPNRRVCPTTAYPLVDPEDIAKRLSDKYDPYMVAAAVYELDSQGLFSKTGEWCQTHEGKKIEGGGFEKEKCYTDFSARFVEFITLPKSDENGT